MCVGQDVADGKSSRPWAMHGQPPRRPPGPSTEYPSSHSSSGPNSRTLSIPTLKSDHWSIFKVRMHIMWRMALIPYFESRSVVDFTYRKGGLCGLCSRPSPGSAFIYTKISARPRSGFYLHKECRAGEIWILSTQRIPRGRGSDVDLHKRFMGPCFNDNLLSKMSAIVKTISALRALFLKKLFPKDSNLG